MNPGRYPRQLTFLEMSRPSQGAGNVRVLRHPIGAKLHVQAPQPRRADGLLVGFPGRMEGNSIGLVKSTTFSKILLLRSGERQDQVSILVGMPGNFGLWQVHTLRKNQLSDPDFGPLFAKVLAFRKPGVHGGTVASCDERGKKSPRPWLSAKSMERMRSQLGMLRPSSISQRLSTNSRRGRCYAAGSARGVQFSGTPRRM